MKKIKRILTVLMCISMCLPVLRTSASSSEEIQAEIEEYKNELTEQSNSADVTEDKIMDIESQIMSLTSEIETQNIKAEECRENMSARIKYFYESGGTATSVFAIIFQAESFSEMLDRLNFLEEICDYDQNQLTAYTELIQENQDKKQILSATVKTLQTYLSEEEKNITALEETINEKEQELQDAKDKEEQERIQKEKEETERKKQEEEKRLAELQAIAEEEKTTDADTTSSGTTNASSSETIVDPNATGSGLNWTSSDGRFVVVNGVAQESGKTSGGKMTKTKGVVYFNGHKETYYSQRILPGGGLKIPGRHVNSEGLVCDGDGYICLASSDYPHNGTVAVLTSLGWGKVYDCGCASGTIDIYVDW